MKIKKIIGKIARVLAYFGVRFMIAPTLIQKLQEENPELYKEVPWYHKMWGIALISFLISLIIVGVVIIFT